MTDSGGGRSAQGPTEDRPNFRFDLGGALARLGGAREPAARPETESDQPASQPETEPESPDPVASNGSRSPVGATDTDPVSAPERGVPVEPLPTRATFPIADRLDPETLREPAGGAPEGPLPRRGSFDPAAVREQASAPEPTARSYSAPRRSVFEDGDTPPRLPSPTSQTTIRPSPTAAPIPAPAAEAPGLPLPGAPVLPTLPAAAPAAPVLAPVLDSAPSTPDINALRSAQLRASRQQRQGKLFGRTMLALLVIGGLIAAALVFGRSYLFPTEWDAALTPIVDEIQLERGVEFDHTVGLVRQPAADYALTIGRLVIDDVWIDALPQWRALGLASGEPNPDSIAPEIARRRLAVYDPDADRIYLSADADPAAAAADLRVAAEAAYAAQVGPGLGAVDATSAGLLGVSPLDVIAERAVDSYLARRGTVEDTPAQAPASDTVTSVLPLPIEYELTAIDVLGEPLLAAAGLDPATVTFASALPEDLGATLDDTPAGTTSGLLLVGDRSLADPVALGVDDWSLAWATRLPNVTVQRLTSIVVADSYRPIDRGGVTCVVGVFETAAATQAGYVLSSLTSWAASAPPASQAVASQLSDTRVQLVACDPGIDAATTADAGVVRALLDRQLARLAG